MQLQDDLPGQLQLLPRPELECQHCGVHQQELLPVAISMNATEVYLPGNRFEILGGSQDCVGVVLIWNIF